MRKALQGRGTNALRICHGKREEESINLFGWGLLPWEGHWSWALQEDGSEPGEEKPWEERVQRPWGGKDLDVFSSDALALGFPEVASFLLVYFKAHFIHFQLNTHLGAGEWVNCKKWGSQMAQVLGRMACSFPPLFVPHSAIFCSHLYCINIHHPGPPLNPSYSSGVHSLEVSPSLCGQVSWVLELLQFPLLFRSKRTIVFLGQSSDLWSLYFKNETWGFSFPSSPPLSLWG